MRPNIATSAKVIMPFTRAVAGSTNVVLVELRDAYGNLASEFHDFSADIQSTIASQNNSYDGCLHCTGSKSCSLEHSHDLCRTQALFSLGSAQIPMTIPSRVAAETKMNMTAVLPAYREWPSTVITFLTSGFEVVSGAPWTIKILQEPSNGAWRTLSTVYFSQFPIVKVEDQFGNAVMAGYKLQVQISGCGEDSRIENTPHFWLKDETPQSKVPFAYTDGNGTVEFQNFTLLYFNENKPAQCELAFIYEGRSYITASWIYDARPPIYPNGDPHLCPCIDPWNYSRRLINLDDDTDLSYTDRACAWRISNVTNNGRCLSPDYGVRYPKFRSDGAPVNISNRTDMCTPTDQFFSPVCWDPSFRGLTSSPTWCPDLWCWVDPFNCDPFYKPQSAGFMGPYGMVLPEDYELTGTDLDHQRKKLWWSGRTCGKVGSYNEWSVASIAVELEPLSVAEAGNSFGVQPTIVLLDAAKVVVASEEYEIVAAICRPCPCPCARQDGMTHINASNCSAHTKKFLQNQIY